MREIKFRSYNKTTEKMMPWDFIRRVKNLHKLLTLNHVEVMQYTGLKDCNGNEIYDGDTLIDLDVELEDGVKLKDTQQQVFWNEYTGSWHLDNSFKQDKNCSTELWLELNDFKFKVFGNIYKK